MPENGWFNTGKEATDRASAKPQFGVSHRYYLKVGGEGEIVFIDGDNTVEEPIGSYREHAFVTKDGKWPNFASCPGKGCQVCREGLKPYDAWPFTIIQLKPTWTDRAGKEHTNEIKLLVAKKEAMQKILRHIGLRKGLIGTQWNVFRSGQKSYTIGDDWQFQRKIGGDGVVLPLERRILIAKEFSLKPEDVKQINYREALKPKTIEELMAEGIDFEGTKRREASFFGGGQGGGQAGAQGGQSGGQAAGGQPNQGAGSDVPY
jgi:hypothetical protein